MLLFLRGSPGIFLSVLFIGAKCTETPVIWLVDRFPNSFLVHTDRQTDKTYLEVGRQTNKQTVRHPDRQTNRMTDRHTKRHTGRQKGRHTCPPIQIKIFALRSLFMKDEKRYRINAKSNI